MSSMLRKIKRDVARNRMKKAGYTQLNKRSKDRKGAAIGRSKFAEHWREYVR